MTSEYTKHPQTPGLTQMKRSGGKKFPFLLNFITFIIIDGYG